MSEKKRILLTVCSFEIGGIEKSLVELLRMPELSKYDVDVLAFAKRGELLEYVPQSCHLLPELPACAAMFLPLKQALLQSPGIGAARLAAKMRSARRYRHSDALPDALIFAYLQEMWDATLPVLPQLETEYDAALSFMWPHQFVAEKVRAKKKIAWVHTDYTKAVLDHDRDLAVWEKFDHIAAVSDECGATFCRVYPTLSDRVVTVENVLSADLVRERADAFLPKEMHNAAGTHLLSVGRYCYAKAFDRVPEICRILLDRGQNVTWFLIGYGTDAALIEENIRKFRVEDRVLLLGKQSNPYPYVKACDLYVQPSRYEGKAVTVREALILGKPVMISDFNTARSQVRDGVDALIAGNDAPSIADGIERLLKDKPLRETLAHGAATADYGCEEQMRTLCGLIG